MKKTHPALSLLFLCILNLAYAQPGIVKQILTIPDGDVQNPSFPGSDYNHFIQRGIVFEIHKNTNSNIYYMKYDGDTDTFGSTVQVTNDNYQDINPICLISENNSKPQIFYQTNRSGSWEFGYKKYVNDTLSAFHIIDDSTDAEFKPAFFFRRLWDNDTQRILYIKNNSVYMATRQDSSYQTELVFESNDSVKYSEATGTRTMLMYDTEFSGINVVAKKVFNSGKIQLVFRHINPPLTWSNELVIEEGCYLNNPRFIGTDFPVLSYENLDGNFSNVFIRERWYSSNPPQKLIDSINGNYSSLNFMVSPIVTKQRRLSKIKDFNVSYYPHTYKYNRSDSSFIAGSGQNYYAGDTLIYTKVNSATPELGQAGSISGFVCFYTIWEDSINGRVGLRGIRTLVGFGDVSDPSSPNSFELYQNYPNPFNPSTKIKYHLSKNGYVTLIIYDLLGRRIETLVEGYKSVGDYNVIFNASKYSSGIYFYRLTSSDDKNGMINYSQTRKMILLK